MPRSGIADLEHARREGHRTDCTTAHRIGEMAATEKIELPERSASIVSRGGDAVHGPLVTDDEGAGGE